RNLTNIENLALVYMFDTQSNSWSKMVEDSYVSRKRSLSVVVDYDRKMYLFGGWLINNEYTNDMFILDTINLSWSSLNATVPMVNYGATLLPNKNIIYIGLDGKQVIIFGGKENTIINPKKSLYNLNINTFEWSIPNVSGGISKSRYYHKAHVIGKYMVISFGMGYNKSIESDILLLDINNNNEYKWTSIFDPSTPPSPSSPFLPSLRPSTNPKTLSRITPAAMAGAIIGTLFDVILLSFGSYFLYKWNKNNQNKKHITRTILIPHSYSNC
ncbi:22210_t:CDS:2, partial [Rhizophagus irregularis]